MWGWGSDFIGTTYCTSAILISLITIIAAILQSALQKKVVSFLGDFCCFIHSTTIDRMVV